MQCYAYAREDVTSLWVPNVLLDRAHSVVIKFQIIPCSSVAWGEKFVMALLREKVSMQATPKKLYYENGTKSYSNKS